MKCRESHLRAQRVKGGEEVLSPSRARKGQIRHFRARRVPGVQPTRGHQPPTNQCLQHPAATLQRRDPQARKIPCLISGLSPGCRHPSRVRGQRSARAAEVYRRTGRTAAHGSTSGAEGGVGRMGALGKPPRDRRRYGRPGESEAVVLGAARAVTRVPRQAGPHRCAGLHCAGLALPYDRAVASSAPAFAKSSREKYARRS